MFASFSSHFLCLLQTERIIPLFLNDKHFGQDMASRKPVKIPQSLCCLQTTTVSCPAALKPCKRVRNMSPFSFLLCSLCYPSNTNSRPGVAKLRWFWSSAALDHTFLSDFLSIYLTQSLPGSSSHQCAMCNICCSIFNFFHFPSYFLVFYPSTFFNQDLPKSGFLWLFWSLVRVRCPESVSTDPIKAQLCLYCPLLNFVLLCFADHIGHTNNPIKAQLCLALHS